MESHQFESQSAPAPLAPPHFEKGGYAPANETAQTSLSLTMDIRDNYYLDLL